MSKDRQHVLGVSLSEVYNHEEDRQSGRPYAGTQHAANEACENYLNAFLRASRQLLGDPKGVYISYPFTTNGAAYSGMISVKPQFEERFKAHVNASHFRIM